MTLFYYVVSLLLPIIFLVLGIVFYKHPPKKINGSAGWRTESAMLNQESWNYANSYGGKCVSILGVVELIISAGIIIFAKKYNENIMAVIVFFLIIVQTLPLITVYKKVENKIKNHFSIIL